MFRSFVCAVVGVALLCHPVLVFAARGPCSVTAESSFQNTIRCENGVCLGMVYNTPEQKDCQNADESACTPVSRPLKITYESKSVNFTTAEVAAHAGVGLACAGCALGVLAVTGWTGPGAIAGVTLACGALCAAAFVSMDGCWFVRCEQDLNTRSETPGGKGC